MIESERERWFTVTELADPEGLFASQGELYDGYREGNGIALFGNDFDPVLFHKWTWTPAD